MTGHAVTGLDRAMAEITASHLVGQFIMTGKTELLGTFLQHGFNIGRMGPVAIGTAPLVNRLMLVFRILNGIRKFGALLVMAVKT